MLGVSWGSVLCPVLSSLHISLPKYITYPPGFNRLQARCRLTLLSFASIYLTSLPTCPVLTTVRRWSARNSLHTPFQNPESLGDPFFFSLCSHIRSAVRRCISPPYPFQLLLLQLFPPVRKCDLGLRAALLPSALTLAFAPITRPCHPGFETQ